MTPSILPPISVIISTKDRGNRIVETIETVLLNDYPEFEVRVVDQSVDNLTETSLLPFMSDSRFCYERKAFRGLSAGRNHAIKAAKSELIASTDDDCTTPANWLRELALAFSINSRTGLIFGNVHSAPHDVNMGFIPAYRREKPYLARSIREKHQVEGIGACMGFRKSLWKKLGGFDELLGPGAPFIAADDTDFSVRTLLSGYYIYEIPSFNVLHHGFRNWQQGRTLIYGYLFGYGAMFAKHFKCGNFSLLFLLAHLMRRWTFGAPVVDFGHCPPRWLRLRAFVKGFMRGFTRPIDSKSCCCLYG
jgi:GT2 family glycosyltransferase